MTQQSASNKWKAREIVLGFLGVIIGIGVSLVFDLTKLKSDDIFRIGDKVEQQIEDRDDFEKSKKKCIKSSCFAGYN